MLDQIGTLGFTQPAALGLTALVVPLLLLHLRARRRPPVTVSSLAIWRMLPAQSLPRRRPRPPLLFWIQAALLTTLAAALAGPTLRRAEELPPPPSRAIVVDLSASMQARDGDQTRFERARGAARELLSTTGARETPWTVIAAAAEPRILGADLEPTAAASTLDSMAPLDTGVNLAGAIELAVARAGAGARVHVFTDVTEDSLVLTSEARRAIELHRFGTSDRNVSLGEVQLGEPALDGGQKSRIVARVRNHSAEPRQVKIVLRPHTADGGGSPANAVPPVATTEVTVPPHDGQIVSLPMSGIAGAFELRLDTPDDLAVDDAVLGYSAPGRSLRILLVSDDAEVIQEFEALTRQLGPVVLQTASSTSYRDGSGVDVVVFDRFVPTIPPGVHTAYLAPERGNPDVTIVGRSQEARAAEVRDHELLAGVQNPEVLLEGDLVGLAPHGDLRPVLLGRSGGQEAALVLAGSAGDRRIVATAFRLGRHRLRDPDALPALVFTLNLLRWLSPSRADAPLQAVTGEAVRARFPDGTPLQEVQGPSGTLRPGPAAEVTFEKAGWHRGIGLGTARDVLVNFVEPAESEIGRPEIPAAPPPEGRPQETPTDRRAERRVPHAAQVLLWAALLMGLEWLVVAFTRERRPDGFAGAGPAVLPATGGEHA